MKFAPLGDAAVIVSLDGGLDDAALAAVTNLAESIREACWPGVIDVVPAYGSVAVFYDPYRTGGEDGSPYEWLREAIIERVRLAGNAQTTESMLEARIVELPVHYGGADGPDLEAVAAHTGLAKEDVIVRHAGAGYRVQAIGFAPGFPYLSGLPAELATPRRPTPRTHVAAGSVGIGGAQTGVYPLASPGGWQLIGQTDAQLFDARRPEPSLLRVGDRVKFIAATGARAISDGPGRISPVSDSAEGARGPGLWILSPGMLTTVQDLGREGQRAAGVPSGGALDALALRLANLLVGNPEDAAGLEFTLIGPEIEFQHDGLIALGGADFTGCAAWRPLRVATGQRIKFGPAVKGCRGYLAVAGGLDVPPVLGSRSTYARAQLGGWQGRALQAGDVVPCFAVRRQADEHWWLDPRILPDYGASAVRVLAGAQADEFPESTWDEEWKVTSQADRMGMRLAGPKILRKIGTELVSAPVAPGTVQLPPDGQPIVLLAEAQTIGGYPRLAHVINVDQPRLAQLRPGDLLRFERVSIGDAHQLWLAREHSLALLREGLAGKIR